MAVNFILLIVEEELDSSLIIYILIRHYDYGHVFNRNFYHKTNVVSSKFAKINQYQLMETYSKIE